MSLPYITAPMLAAAGEVPMDSLKDYVFDTKLDGIRAIAYWDGKRLTLLSRTGRHMEGSFPELANKVKAALGPNPIILDGEIVSIDGAFQDVASREKLTNKFRVDLEALNHPVRFVAFDILRYNDNDLRSFTYRARREIMENLHLAGRFQTLYWRLSETSTNPNFYKIVTREGGEGVIAKKLTSVYTAGRSRNWLKYKATFTLTCVAVGYEAGTGSRKEFGALLLAMVDGDQVVSVGRVGSGFSQAEVGRMKGLLDAFAERDFTSSSPALDTNSLPIVEIKCQGLTRSGLPRQPTYKGQRNDKTMLDATADQLKGLPRS